MSVLEALPQLLPALDSDAVARLHAESERIGIKIRTDVKVRRIEQAGHRLRVVFTDGDIEQTLEADRVVNGVGRIANVEALDVARGRVEQVNGRIVVDRYLR